MLREKEWIFANNTILNLSVPSPTPPQNLIDYRPLINDTLSSRVFRPVYSDTQGTAETIPSCRQQPVLGGRRHSPTCLSQPREK